MKDIIPKLQSLTSLDDDRQLVREACFEAGLHLRSPHDWSYTDLFMGGNDVVTIAGLIEALESKEARLRQKSLQTSTKRIK